MRIIMMEQKKFGNKIITMKKKLLITAIVLVSAAIATYGMLQSGKEKEKVKVKCYYMAYACGDCFANYKIKEVIEAGDGIKGKLLNREVKVVFKSKRLEKQIDSMTAECAICYDYYIEGHLTYQSKKEFSLLEVDTCTVKLRDAKCCKE
jgi:hypothetical protein